MVEVLLKWCYLNVFEDGDYLDHCSIDKKSKSYKKFYNLGLKEVSNSSSVELMILPHSVKLILVKGKHFPQIKSPCGSITSFI